MPRPTTPKVSYPATLELSDIVVTLGNAARKEDDHEAMLSYEYTGPHDDNEAVCWVPAVPGSRFCIHVAYEGESLPYPPNVGLRAQAYIDGLGPVAWTFVPPEEILKRIQQLARRKPVTVGEREMTGYDMKNGYVQPLCFSLRQTAETGSAPPLDDGVPPRNLDKFGNISVLAYWATKSPYIQTDSVNEYDSDDNDLTPLSNPVDEKWKPVQHRFAAGLGEPEPNKASGGERDSNFEGVNDDEEFWFHFKYSDNEWLKTERIAPNHTA
ncbi:hypothetical protein FRC07_008361 [Ceratobasidium sp. 392]|nr:hypothetical protein FRC07_008361 [Ceratobasidium sp. 392]